jgi:tRNA A-37 threonylcarbamoyl transferase component Bud32
VERLGRYELVARLAQGGMGEIFLARLEGAAGFEKLYAIKRILPQFANDGRFRKMLIGEAQIASKMSHSNICQVYELGESDGQLYIVMEYLEGVTLLPLLRACSRANRPLDFGFITAVLMQICDALHYAHELRDRDGRSLDVIHRDVTLANVFVCESGAAKVLDFGIAKVKDAQGTQTGTVKGKYAYMAPEQLRGEDITRRVDVFALGVVAYEMIALRRLFQRPTDYLTFHAVLEQPLAAIRRYRPDIPPALESVVMQALDRDPEKRFPTVRALGSALADAIAPKRPWAQEQVGNLVLELFADETAARHDAVAQAIAQDGAAIHGPPIASNSAEDDDDEQGFPSVETEAGPITGEAHTAVERLYRRAQTGLPVAQVDPVAAPQLEVPPPAPAPSRTWIWIALALVLVAGGGVAVAFMMQQQPPPPTEIIVDKADSETREKDAKALVPHQGQLMACAAKHPSSVAEASVDMLIDMNGKLESVRFEPPEVDQGPLGGCLREVLKVVAFAKRNASTGLHLDLSLPKKKP